MLSITSIKSLDGEVHFNKQNAKARFYKINTFKEKHKELLLKSIIQVESLGKPDAYNPKEDAVGILQIRPIMLRHANQIIGFAKYSLNDRWSKEKSIEIFWVVQEYHNPNLWLDRASHLWNSGTLDKNWDKTERYRNKVSIEYNKLMVDVYGK